MTKRDIKRQISKEERRIRNLSGKIEDIKADMRATRKAIRFWKRELKKSGN